MGELSSHEPSRGNIVGAVFAFQLAIENGTGGKVEAESIAQLSTDGCGERVLRERVVRLAVEA
ncbi:MAG: hypothetical protein R3B07_15975 [Polyangiaceae bacterium]